MPTPSIKKAEIESRWLLIDIEGKTLGRTASQVAALLKGKHKPKFTPHADMGDHVVVINAAKLKLTGRKWANKTYYRHTGFAGGIRSETAQEMHDRKPEDLVYNAVRRMLPRSPLGRDQMRKLRVYAGDQHPHAAQNPEPHELAYS